MLKTLDFTDFFGTNNKKFSRREVAGSNPVAPINTVKSRVCGLFILMKNRKVIKKAINCIPKLFSLKREDVFVYVIISYGYFNEFMSCYHGLIFCSFLDADYQCCHELIFSKNKLCIQSKLVIMYLMFLEALPWEERRRRCKLESTTGLKIEYSMK